MNTLRILLIALVACGAVAQTATSQKVIKDPAEYNAYIAALNKTNPVEKGAAMEAFVQQYPNSIVMLDALEQAMAAYQQAGNAAKVQEIAQRIVDLVPQNVRALAVLTALTRSQVTQGNAQALAKLHDLSERGLQALPQWTKPEGLSDSDFGKLKQQMTGIFNGAAGFAALQQKDYAAARGYYLKSVEADPSNVQDLYQLGIAELETTPLDANGFWYVAKAFNMVRGNAAAQQSIQAYGKGKYRHYHGGEDGWDAIVSQAAGQSVPPEGFAKSVAAAPTPAELAVKAVRENAPENLSFSDKEFVLSYRDASDANRQAAERVWQSIRDMEKNGEARLMLPVKVISATSTKIYAAVSDDNQESNKPDLEVTMEKPMLKPPATGSTTKVIGVITDYKLNPFTFIMDKGELPVVRVRPPVK